MIAYLFESTGFIFTNGNEKKKNVLKPCEQTTEQKTYTKFAQSKYSDSDRVKFRAFSMN